MATHLITHATHYTSAKAAEVLGIKVATLYHKVAIGTLTPEGDAASGRYWFRKTAIHRYKAWRQQGHRGAAPAA